MFNIQINNINIKQTKMIMTKEDIFRVLEINKEQKQQILIQ